MSVNTNVSVDLLLMLFFNKCVGAEPTHYNYHVEKIYATVSNVVNQEDILFLMVNPKSFKIKGEVFCYEFIVITNTTHAEPILYKHNCGHTYRRVDAYIKFISLSTLVDSTVKGIETGRKYERYIEDLKTIMKDHEQILYLNAYVGHCRSFMHAFMKEYSCSVPVFVEVLEDIKKDFLSLQESHGAHYALNAYKQVKDLLIVIYKNAHERKDLGAIKRVIENEVSDLIDLYDDVFYEYKK